MNSPPSATIVPSLERADRELLDRRVAVAGRRVLLATGQRAVNRPPGSLRKLGGDERVLARVVLRAEAAAHVLADDAHLVAGDPELLRDGVADAPDVLRRDVDVERVADPFAHGLVRLHRVVQDDRGAVRALDDDVGRARAPCSKSPRAYSTGSLVNCSRSTASSGSSTRRAAPTRRRSPRRAARACSNVSAATAATAAPA